MAIGGLVNTIEILDFSTHVWPPPNKYRKT